MCKDKELAGVIGAARALLRAARRWGVLGVVLALAVLTVGRVSAQNLVPNPSFESYSAIPTGLAVSGEINLASFWSSPTDASPDYFHSLATSSSSVSVPANVFGSQLPVTGQAYAGFHARPDILYREYVETPLSSPLVAGQTYQVSFYVSLADKCQWAVDKIGAYLSVGSVGPVNTVYTLPFTPQINNPVNNYITNKLGWTLIAGQYVAAGGEDHITIGNFLDDPSTTPQTGQGGFYQFAYYYLDDVSVTPLCAPPPSGMVAWWPLDETSGTTVQDIVSSYDGTAMSDPVTPGPIGSFGTSGPVSSYFWPPPTFPVGQVGNSLFFYSARHVKVPHATALDPSTDGFTVDAWVIYAPSGNGAYLGIVQKGDSGSSDWWRLAIHDTAGVGELKFDVFAGIGGGAACALTPGLWAPGTWHHVAATLTRQVSDAVITLYVDGNQVTTSLVGIGFATSIASTDDLFIGRSDGAATGEFAVDEVEIFGRALSPQEVQGISDARLMGKCGCVKAPSDMGSWWPADGNANDIVGGNHGTLVGSAAFTPGMVGDAFNLTGGHVEVLAPVGLDFGTDDLSIDAWILIPPGSPSLTATYLPIVDKRDLPGGAFGAQSTGYTLFLYDGNLAFQLGDPGPGFYNYISPGPDLRVGGVWHHVAVTVDRDSPTGGNLYVDGAVVLNFNPTNRPGSLTNTQPLFIGRHAGAPSITFVGLIDEVEIFGRALSPQEVQGISDAGSSGKCKPDLGDAPDSSNHAGASMLAYAFPVVPAHFPTVYDPSLSGNAPLGPIHRNAKGLAWLGANVSFEGEADTGWDQELNTLGNNIQPSSGISNRDVDDGVASVPLPDCAMTSFKFSATNAGITPVGVYINVWFDWTRDGDWDDMPRCALDPVTTVLAPEWAVQNYLIALSPGFNAWPANPAMKTPAFLSMSPPLGQTVWMRITLTDVPIDANANGGPFPYPADLGKGGSGPAGGYCYGETEDYEIGPCGIVRGSIVAHDVYTSSVPYLQTTGDVRIEECVTRDTDAAGNVTDTYTYIVTNVSVYNNGCGLCAFQVPSPGLIGSMQNDLGWGNTMSSAWWLWRAALSPNCQSNPAYYGIQVGQSGRFWFSVPGPTSDTHVWAYGMLCDSQNPSPDLRLWTTGPATPCVQAPPGMISWWPGDGNTSDIMDSNPGTLLGSAGYAPGIVGQAFSFVAAGDGVSVSNAANLNFGGGDLSIDAWIVTSSTAGVLPIVDKRSGASGSQATGYTLFLFGGRLAFQLGDGTFFNYISASLLSDLRDGLPHHVAVTVDRTSNTGGNLYVDGVVVLNFNPTNRPGSLTNGEPLFIGRHAGTPSTSFIGLIDEVEIFGRELTAGEVLSIFTAGTAGKCK